MNSGDRLKALIAVWIACFLMALTIAIFAGALEGWAVVSLGGMLMIMTLLGTFMITRSGGASSAPIEREEIRGKAKRSDTALIERLIDSMSDEELAALRRRLIGEAPTIGDDGEIIPGDQPMRRTSRTPKGDA